MNLADSIRVVQHTVIGENEERIPAGYEIQVLGDGGDWVPITEVEEHHESRLVIVEAQTKLRKTK